MTPTTATKEPVSVVSSGLVVIPVFMRRVLSDAFVSAGVVAMVFAVLVSIDVRVREQMSALLTSGSFSGTGGDTWRQLGSTLVHSVMTQSIEHAPMTIFVVAGAVLLLCMVRS
jgi:hypothetical protein